MEQELLKPLLKEVNEAFNAVEAFFFDTHRNLPLRSKVQEAWFKTRQMEAELTEGPVPNWYILYEGLCGSHVEQRAKYRAMQNENKELRAENIELHRKVQELNDALNRVYCNRKYDETL